MKISKFIAFAAASTLALSGLVVVANSAQAYPTGQNMVVTSSKYAVKADSKIKVQASRVFPGCKVTFTFDARNSDSVTATAGRNGVTQAEELNVPEKAGTYQLIARTKSNCNPPTGVETATATIVVTGKSKESNKRD
jgi:hypothetical protein